ncbi:pentapeptide repeat-containing protein [Streptomyces sp. NPDC046925]|uniref:pentapeptide repeat-containing protein n=1 Tax=Streptomyces sp. NPDC046925 TaxID=3155375 RepID=UPI0034028989
MNPARLTFWMETRYLPPTGFGLAALGLLVVLVLAYRDRAEPNPDDQGAVAAHAKRRLTRYIVGGTASVAMFILLFWQGPWWLDGLHIRKTQLEAADGVVITGFRTGLVALAAGLIAAVGLYYTREKHRLERDEYQHSQDQFRESQKQFEITLRETQKRDEQQAALTREGQVTGRYVEAIKLIGSDRKHEILGGIYSLERIAIDSPDDRDTIVEVLAAYVRTRLNGQAEEFEKFTGTLSPGLSPQLTLEEDIRAALRVLARSWRRDRSKADLRTINLFGWDAKEADFTGADMFQAQLQSALLPKAGLQHARLQEADLTEAVLTNAFLSDALLFAARLNRAQLEGACLRRAILRGTDLNDATLTGAQLQGADLSGANLQGATLTQAELENATLTDVFGLEVGQICVANIYPSTQLGDTLAAHPDVQARIAACEEARTQGKPPPLADPTQHWAT